MRKVLLLFATVMVSSCGLYKQFETPEMDFDGLCSTVETTKDTLELPAWDQIFNDSNLSMLVDSVLAQNTDLKVAMLRIDQANQQYKTAKLDYLPTLNTSISIPFSDISNEISASISSILSLDTSGKIRNSRKEAKENVMINALTAQAVRAGLVESTIINYATMIMLEEQLSMTLDDIERARNNLSLVEKLKDDGTISEAAYLQLLAAYKSIEGETIPYYGRIAVSQGALSKLLAEKPGNIPHGDFESLKINSLFEDGIPVYLLSNRTDVQIAEHKLAKAYYATNVAKGSFYPSITVTTLVNWKDDLLANAVGSITQSIFSHLSIAHKYRIAKAEQEAARLTFVQSLLNAGSEVYLYTMGLKGTYMIRDSKQDVVNTLEQSLNEIEKNLMDGSVDYMDLINTQRSLHEAKLELAESKYNIVYMSLKKYMALGGGTE